VPLQQDLQTSLPLDRVRITFEAQDGSLPLGPLTWDRNYENNTLSTDVFITDYPDLSLASPQNYANGDAIRPSLPYYCGEIIPCTKPLFLYVNDAKLNYAVPNVAPTNLRVWLGSGPFETSPSDPGWVWFPAVYQRDFTDDNGRAYKVFRSNLCALNLALPGKKSYCFRSSLDFTDDHPTYAYVDQDGCSTVRGRENVYFLNAAGVVDWPCHTMINGPDVIGVGLPALFDGIGSTGSDGWPIVEYNWDFGDSTAGSGMSVVHAYSEPGDYVLQLCTMDLLGIQQCATKTVNVVFGTGNDPVPIQVRLYPAHPNPFNPSTTLSFDVASTSEVKILIIDVRGRKVRQLVQRRYDAGTHSVVWDGRDDSGMRMQSGAYLVRLVVGSETRSGRLVLLK
jgi:PKD domain/FlgD Ig-like domain